MNSKDTYTDELYGLELRLKHPSHRAETERAVLSFVERAKEPKKKFVRRAVVVPEGFGERI